MTVDFFDSVLVALNLRCQCVPSQNGRYLEDLNAQAGISRTSRWLGDRDLFFPMTLGFLTDLLPSGYSSYSDAPATSPQVSLKKGFAKFPLESEPFCGEGELRSL